jgi:hypothetical protein
MLDSLDGWSGDRMNAWTQPVFQGAWAQLGMDIAALEQTLYSWLSGQCVNSNCPTPQNGMWSEFTPDNNGGYYWIVHAGTGVALQQPDGSWLSKVLASNDSKANAIFDLTPTSSCDSINEKLPKSHPSGMSLPSGNWQSNCGALSWDGNTLTTQCNGTDDNPSSLDMGMCSASDITVDLAMDKVSLMCGAGLYDANITALINANSATPNPFLSTSSSKCQILDVTDDSPESTIATAAGISSITAECYSQPLQLSSGSGIVPVVSTIDPQSCVLPSGSYDIVSLNGSLACGGGSASAPNDIGAVISSGSDFATAAVPLTNSAGIIQVLQSEDQWLGTDINPVNNVSYINWSQVCTDNNLMFSPGTDNLQCDNYQSDLTPLLQANTTLFNGSVGSSQTNNPCNIIGASRDESGNLQEIEYTCAYSSNVPYGASGFYNYTGTINPSACYDNVMVESAGSGELSCSLQPPSPTINISGSWKNSCYNATFDGNNLTATCRFNNNEYVQSTLAFYSTCAGNSTVSNNNGYLECDEYGGYWSTQLLSTNNWLAEGNNSCIIQNVAFTPPPGSGVTNITAMCQGQYGYNQTSINPSKCPLFRGQQLIILQNNNGSLVCG